MGVVVNAVLVELRSGAVEADGHVLAGFVACFADSFDYYVEGIFGAVEGRSETAFVADCRREAAGFEHFLKVVEHLCAHAYSLVVAAGAHGTDHEFLETDGGVRVRTAVDDIHHRNGQHICVATADVLVKGQIQIVGSSLCNSERNAKNCICAKIALGVSAVKSQHFFIDCNLVESAHPF